MSRLPDIVMTDFSGGQVNNSAKRRDDLPIVKAGAKQASNFRVEATGTLLTRPARKALFPTLGWRTEYFRMEGAQEFQINFGVSGGLGVITILSLDGTQSVVNTSPLYIWTFETLNQISWCQAVFDLFITFPGMQPQIVRWSQSTGEWTFLEFSPANIAGQSQEPFYRFDVLGATMTYSALTGEVVLTCSEPFFTPNMVGSILSIVGQQVRIVSIIDDQNANVLVAFQLPACVTIWLEDTSAFAVGQIATSVNQNIKIEIGDVNPGVGVNGVMLSNLIFDYAAYTADDTLVSPTGSSPFSETPTASVQQMPTVQWQEQFMSVTRGWPAACAYTAGRVCLYGFPQLQEAILWGAISADDIFWVDSVAAANNPAAGTLADAAILEFEASRPAIVSVLEWGDIFVFTDRGIFHIPISQATPLAPGNVQFVQFSNDGVSIIRPVSTQDAIVYINAGLNRCSVVRATGSLTRPYVSEDVSDVYGPLFTGPVALAIATGDGDYPERYVYVVNADGSLIVGKFTQQRQLVGWLPWTCTGLTKWVTNAGPNVWFSTQYGLNIIFEVEDPDLYFDGAVFVNNPVPGMANGSLGPLWHFASEVVSVMDGAIDYGDFNVDAAGHLLAPANEYDFSSPTLAAGSHQPAVWQPFLFPPREGTANAGARGKRRRLQRIVLSVEQSNGFSFGTSTIPPVNFGEDPTVQPVMRECTYRKRFLGRSLDPQCPPVIKDRPGPLRIVEFDAWLDD